MKKLPCSRFAPVQSLVYIFQVMCTLWSAQPLVALPKTPSSLVRYALLLIVCTFVRIRRDTRNALTVPILLRASLRARVRRQRVRCFIGGVPLLQMVTPLLFIFSAFLYPFHTFSPPFHSSPLSPFP